MVELLCIEADHLKIFAMMIIMAFNALFSTHTGRSMIPPVFINSDSNIQVTIQTLLIGHFVAEYMAFGTI